MLQFLNDITLDILLTTTHTTNPFAGRFELALSYLLGLLPSHVLHEAPQSGIHNHVRGL
jgi:hypothetical protein